MRTSILMAAAILTTAPVSNIIQWVFWFVLGFSIVLDFVEVKKK
tara:strand:+ start:126 stop:257 length:132 start_codon:yes stop_codon:yes gene_type:complete